MIEGNETSALIPKYYAEIRYGNTWVLTVEVMIGKQSGYYTFLQTLNAKITLEE